MQFPSKLFQTLSISGVIYQEICVGYFEAVMIIPFDEIFFSFLFCTEDFKVRETVQRQPVICLINLLSFYGWLLARLLFHLVIVFVINDFRQSSSCIKCKIFQSWRMNHTRVSSSFLLLFFLYSLGFFSLVLLSILCCGCYQHFGLKKFKNSKLFTSNLQEDICFVKVSRNISCF